MYKYKPKNKKWSKLGALVAETANAVKQEGTVHSDADSIPQTKSQIQGVGTVIPELYQLALQQQNRKQKNETAAFRETYPMLPNPHDDPPSDSFAYKPKRETEGFHFMPSTDLPEQWKQATEDQTKQTTYSLENSVENFISTMGPEEQASLRGVNPTEWKTMVVDRLNDVNMSADEFNHLERYYGLSLENEGTKTTFSNEKMSYGEYRAKVAQQRIDDVNAALQQYFADYQSFVNSATQDFQSIDYQNASSMRGNWSKTATELRKQADDLLSVLQTSGDIIPGDYSELLSTLSLTKQDIRSVMNVFEEQEKYYSQWGSEEAYKADMAAYQEHEKMMTFDLEAGAQEISYLEYKLQDYDFLVRFEHDEEGEKRLERYRNEYGSVANLEQIIQEKKAYLKRVAYLQEGQTLSLVTANEDFDTYSRYVSTKSDGWWDNLRSQYGMGYDDLKYEYINGAKNGMRSEITEKSTTWDGTITHQFGIYDHMKPDEISTYNYYYAKYGKEQAEEYLDYITDTLEARSDSLTVQEAKKLASDHKFLSSALSVAANLATGVEYLEDVVDYGVEKMKGNPYASLGTNQAALMSSTVRSTVAEQVDWEIGNWDAFDFLYNTTMSGADSIVASTLFGKFGGIALGLSAAAQGTNDALNRGMSDGQAFWSGLISGVFEGLFESVSIGQFSSLQEVAPESLKDIFKNLGKSMLVNASEETLTEIANIGYDTLVNGEFAHYTLEELKSGAWKDALWQVLESGASGLLIGTGMSMVGSTGSYVNQQARYYDTGKGIVGVDGGIEALMNLANEVAGVSSTEMQSMLTSQIDKVSQNPTARNVGQLNATVQAANTQANATANQASAVWKPDNTATNRANTIINQADVAKSLRNKGVYSRKVDSLAEVIAARLNGQELTRSQRSFLSFELGRPAVQSVISEFIHNSKATTEQYSQDIRQNMLPDQELSNPENLQRDQISQQRYNEFSEATNLSELHKQREKSRGAWMHGKKAENVIKERNAASAMEFFGAESKDDLKSIIQRSTIKLKNGFSCFPEGDVLNTNIKEVAELDGFFDVGMHGTSTAVGFGSEKTNMSARTLAAIVYHSKGYNGQKIRLLSCSTGRIVGDEYCFAEELANALGVEVIAPDDILYISSKGNLQVGDAGNGKFVTFKPNQRRRIK